MPLNEKIGVVREHPQALQFRLHSLKVNQCLGIATGEPISFLLDPYTQLFEYSFGMHYTHGIQSYHTAEVLHREYRQLALAIEPDVPQEERIDNQRIKAEESREINHRLVIERTLYAYTVKALGIALVILYCISISMQHIGAMYDATGSARLSLQQIIVIAVHTSYHIAPQPLSQLVHHGHLLPFGQRCI